MRLYKALAVLQYVLALGIHALEIQGIHKCLHFPFATLHVRLLKILDHFSFQLPIKYNSTLNSIKHI